MKRFDNQVVLVSGAGRGIGAACAKRFALEGARVVITSRTESELLATQKDIVNATGNVDSVRTFTADISVEKDVQRLFAWIQKTFGRLDILVNNAGVIVVKPFIEAKAADFDLQMAVNVRGTYLCSQEAFRGMATNGGGCIVNVSSLAGIRGTTKFPGLAAYTASKHAVVGLTESLSAEGEPFGIRVNCVAPGAVKTRMLKEAFPDFDAKTMPEDISESILFLADPKQVHTGTILEVHCNG